MLHLRWHPSASNVLASAAADNVIIIWNTETGEQLAKTEPLPDMMQSICWNYDGSKIALTCKDKKIRVMNARTGAFEKVCPITLGFVCKSFSTLCRKLVDTLELNRLELYIVENFSLRLGSLDPVRGSMLCGIQ